jgi:hypothetical protein
MFFQTPWVSAWLQQAIYGSRLSLYISHAYSLNPVTRIFHILPSPWQTIYFNCSCHHLFPGKTNSQSVTSHNTADVGLLSPISGAQIDITALRGPLSARLLCLLTGLLLKLKITTPRSTLKSIVRCDVETQISYREVKRKFPLTFN